jgi:ribosome-associated protein
VREVEITAEPIRLGQLLKLAGVVASGAEAKTLLAQQTLTVNGRVEQRRGRQLHKGDIVAVGALELRLR